MLVQITLYSEKYKPMSTIIEVPNAQEFLDNKREYKDRAIDKICAQRKTSRYWLKYYGYTIIKYREYKK